MPLASFEFPDEQHFNDMPIEDFLRQARGKKIKVYLHNKKGAEYFAVPITMKDIKHTIQLYSIKTVSFKQLGNHAVYIKHLDD